MAPRKRSGLNVARKRLRDGTVREYFYDRASGLFLGNERDEAEAKVREATPAVPADPGTVGSLITRYLARPEFRTKLAPRTQELYRGYLEEMRSRYGDLPFRTFGPEAVEDIKASFAAQPRKANQILALFRILLGYAVKLRLLRENPALRPEMLPTPARSEIWTHEQEAAFMAVARPALRLAFMLLLYTVQRPGDVLSMTAARVREQDGRMLILLRQAKTGTLLEVPLHDRLAPLVRERLAAREMLLVASPRGLPWAYRNFSRAWDAAMQAAGLSGLQRRDLRRTGVVRLAEAGATVPQIASLTGWSVDYCQRIVDTYLPRRTEVAIGAIELWEGAAATDSRVVTLGLARRFAHPQPDMQTANRRRTPKRKA
jgi:integrase